MVCSRFNVSEQRITWYAKCHSIVNRVRSATLPPNLTELNLFNNLIKKLPPSIGDLAKLEEVNIAANKLMITTDAMFVKWSAVTVLNLYDNNLVRFGSLVNCVSLTELRLSGNALEALPTLSSHRSLKIFEMHKNRVSGRDGSITGDEPIDRDNDAIKAMSYGLMWWFGAARMRNKLRFDYSAPFEMLIA